MADDNATELDVRNLKHYRPRRFVPEDANLKDTQEVVALYEELLGRDIESAKELEEWLMDRSELEAAADETGSVLYIRMTCQTDDQERAEAYKAFIKEVVPAIKPVTDKLDRKYLAERARFPLDEQRYDVHDRALRADVELFRKENVPLETQVSLLGQEYQTVCGAMTVEFDGEERTLPQMRKFLQVTDRNLRERAFRAVAERRLRERNKLEQIFDQMLGLRVDIAANAGYEDYQRFKFREYHRFDYEPKDCAAFRDAVEELVVPLADAIYERRHTLMGVEALRPWDTAVDPLGRDPLKPFETTDELKRGVGEVFRQTDPILGEQFSKMVEQGLLDLSSRKGKAPGGYQSTLSEARVPFIFMNAVGVDDDLRTLLHEGGHAFHAFAAQDEPLLGYRHAPMEFCEVASMGMELLAGDNLSVFYDEEALNRSRRQHLEGIVTLLPWVATIDGFQDWIYTHPGATRDERRSAWLAVRNRFRGHVVDWSGLDEEHAYLWHRQLHIFEVPFYYIEYGIAQLGALQLWVRAHKVGTQALADYRKALALGGSQPLPGLFEAAGLRFDFGPATIEPLVNAVAKALEKL